LFSKVKMIEQDYKKFISLNLITTFFLTSCFLLKGFGNLVPTILLNFTIFGYDEHSQFFFNDLLLHWLFKIFC